MKPNEQYKLTSVTTDEWLRKWTSYIYFTSNGKGKFSLIENAPDSGSYSGVDPLGIFWSGQLEKNPPEIKPGKHRVDSSIIEFVLTKGKQEITRKSIMRWFVRPGVIRKEVGENGIIATLYTPAKTNNKKDVVMLVGGSGGGNTWQRTTAGVLASQGYTALALAYFKADGLPSVIEKIPIEYIQKAIDFIKNNNEIQLNSLTIMGYSRGAELALISASLLCDIKRVIAFAPSHVVYQSFNPPKFPLNSSWTYNGEELPFVPYNGFSSKNTNIQNYHQYLADSGVVKKASIKIENSCSRFLLLAGTNDLIWPSAFMAGKIKDRALQGSKIKVTQVNFEDAGHAIARPGYMPTTLSVNNGGTPKGNAYAQKIGWNEVLRFLKDE